MSVFNRFDLNLLVVFEAVYAERGVSRAAERLSLTQSAVSHAIGRLREQIGDPLFTRHGHIMKPNSTADQLIEPIRAALSTMRASLESLKSFEPESSTRHFKIGVRGYTESLVIPELFKKVRWRAPGITMSAFHYSRAALPILLSGGGVDIAIDTHTSAPDKLASEKLSQGKMVALLRSGHPALSGAFNLDQYLVLDHIVASGRRSGYGPEDIVLRSLGHSRRVVLRCQNYVTASQIVAETDAVTTLPEHFAGPFAEGGKFVVADPFGGLTFDLCMYWSHANTHDPASVWLRNLIRECMQGLEPLALDQAL